MLIIEDKKTQLDDLLDKMAEELQLDDTRYNRIIKHYEAVKNWIESDTVFFGPHKYDIYPHGSVRTLTTVRPIGKDEFDLDIAIQLKTEWKNHSPEKVYNELKRRLEENETYKGMLEMKKRCIRLNYSGDILPGIQESMHDENKIRVPDRELGRWVSSNPRGYSKWFMGQNDMVKESLLEKALNAEKIPSDNFKNKKPLQRAVQLIKRYRDLHFLEDDTYKTSSIILTTIAGQFYSGEDSIYNAVDGIITRIRAKISSSNVRIKVFNPVNQEEDFTDKWEQEPEYYAAFQKFCEYLDTEWQKLKKENGIIEEGKVLRQLFGNDIFAKAQSKQTAAIELKRKQNDLGINKNTGVLSSVVGASTMPIKPNTFFGK